ncbi:penicillin acylase family protein [soil metagenome]
MKIIKKTFTFILVLVLVTILGVLIYLTSQKPQYSGQVQLKGLQKPVEILYDFYGVPHIYASKEEDAYFALGYVHAQDRLFQMEMIRRVASGRLSEILGPDLLKVDVFFRTLGLEEHAKQSQLLYLNADSLPCQRAAHAYLAGLNQFIESGRTPVEFIMLGIPKEKFTAADLYLTTEFMAFNFAMGFKTDPLMSFIQRKLGKVYFKDLITSHQNGSLTIPVYQKPDTAAMHATAFNTIDKILELLPVAPMVGSNGWVMAPSKSRTGKVLFANDTHIGYGQPSVWYEAHIEYPGFSFYGNHLAGWPFAAIGHSRQHAWGLTMFENDDLDFYSERIKPGDSTKYWSDGKWKKLEVKTIIIKIKGQADEKLTVRTTRHGPLMQDAMPEWKAVTNDAVAAWWTHLKFPSNLLEVTYDLAHSSDMSATKNAVSKIISPGLNVMYGDNEGNIAWWAAGRLMRRSPNCNPVLLQDGTGYSNDPTGYYDFKDNPQSENPPEGYLYSANNQPDTMTGGVYYPGYYCPDDRAKRLVSLLTEKPKYSIEDMQRMNTDAVSPAAPAIAHSIIDFVSQDMINKTPAHYDASKKLLLWNGDHQLRDAAPTIYYKLIYHVLQDAMEDEMGKDNFNVFLGTHVMKNTLLSFMENDSSVWWNDINTRDVKETRSKIFDKAFDQTVEELVKQLGPDIDTWEWGRVHILEHEHLIGMKKPFNLFFNVGPYAVPGGQEVLNQIGFTLNGTGIYKAKYGPAMRIVIDFADVENSKSVLPTGQSGNVMSPFYYDQAVMYNTNKSRKQKMNAKEIKSNISGRLVLQPAQNRPN